MAAAAHVVGVQDVEADHLARVAVHSNAGMGLAGEEAVGLLLGEFLELRERHALTHDLVPDFPGSGRVLFLIFPDRYHAVKMGVLFNLLDNHLMGALLQ